jgi:hypothetical protein
LEPACVEENIFYLTFFSNDIDMMNNRVWEKDDFAFSQFNIIFITSSFNKLKLCLNTGRKALCTIISIAVFMVLPSPP